MQVYYSLILLDKWSVTSGLLTTSFGVDVPGYYQTTTMRNPLPPLPALKLPMSPAKQHWLPLNISSPPLPSPT